MKNKKEIKKPLDSRIGVEMLGVMTEDCVCGDLIFYNPENGRVSKVTQDEIYEYIKQM